MDEKTNYCVGGGNNSKHLSDKILVSRINRESPKHSSQKKKKRSWEAGSAPESCLDHASKQRFGCDLQ